MSTKNDTELSIEQIRALPPHERIPYLRLLRIVYPRAKAILDELRSCLDDIEISADPVCRLLVGPSGAGKSTLLQIILEENERYETETNTIVPVFLATVDSPATPGSLTSRLLEALGDPRFERGTIANRTFRVEKFLDDCQTKMIIVDEIQHFFDRDSKKILQTVTDALKNLIKKKPLVCVLTGLQGEAEMVVESNPQLSRLFAVPLVLEPFSWDESNPKTILEFRTLLSEVEKLLPLREASNLHYRELSWRIFVATGGLMGLLMPLIKGATKEALKQGKEHLDLDLLADAFDRVLAAERQGVANPFIGEPPDTLPVIKRHNTNGSSKRSKNGK